MCIRDSQGPGTDAASVALIRKAVDEGRECVVELLNYHKDGTPFWNRLSITPVLDEGGRVTHFIGLQSDISARRKAEEALRSANRQLHHANRRMAQNLEMASRIQRAFLPRHDTEIDGVTFAWQLRPCDELAGDTINFAPLDDRHVEVYSIDVSGHGVAAALLSVTLNHLLSPEGGRLVLADPDHEVAAGTGIMAPTAVAETLNRQFPFDPDRNQFFTIAYGVYDVRDRQFRFVSAGHPPPILVPRSGEPRYEQAQGTPIGVDPDAVYRENVLQLTAGDRVYLYSDGLIDVLDHREEPYDVERLARTLAGLRHETLSASLNAALEDVERWGRNRPLADDVSILAFEAR